MTKLRRMFADSLVYSIGGASRQLAGIILVPVYTRVFAPAEFGVIDLLTVLLTVVTLVLQMGTDSALGRYFSDTAEISARRAIASTVLYYSLGAATVVMIAGLVGSAAIAGMLLRDPGYAAVVRLAMLSIPFTLLFVHFKNVLKWQQRPKAVVTLGLTALVFQLILTIVLVVGLRAGLAGVYGALLVTHVLFSAVGFALTRDAHRLTFSSQWLSKLMRFGAPLVFVGITSSVLTYADRYFLQYFRGLEAVGIYGLSYKLASFLALLFMGVNSALGPFVFSTYREPDAPATFARLFDYVSIAYSAAVVALSLYSRELVLIFGTREYLGAYAVVPLLAASQALYTLGAYFSFGLLIAGKTQYQMWASLLAAALNLALNAVLISRYGIFGAGAATLISYVAWGALLMTLSQRFYRVPFRIARNVLLHAIGGVLIVGVYLTVATVTPVMILLKAGLLAAFATVPVALRLVDQRDLRAAARAVRFGISGGRRADQASDV